MVVQGDALIPRSCLVVWGGHDRVFFFLFRSLAGLQGRSLDLKRELNLPALFSGSFKFVVTKPTRNINLASTYLCLVTAVTGGLSFV